MRNIIVIFIVFIIQTPALGYKIVHRKIPPIYRAPGYNYYNSLGYQNYNYPRYYTYNRNPNYRSFNPISRIKRYFIGTPTGYTTTPLYPQINTQNQRSLFSDNGGDEFYYDDSQYYRKKQEINGGGSVTIIND